MSLGIVRYPIEEIKFPPRNRSLFVAVIRLLAPLPFPYPDKDGHDANNDYNTTHIR